MTRAPNRVQDKHHAPGGTRTVRKGGRNLFEAEDRPNWPDPIFVTGHPHSGTTLVQLLLAAHSNLSSGPETHFFSYVLNSEKVLDTRVVAASELDVILERLSQKPGIQIGLELQKGLRASAQRGNLSTANLLDAVMRSFATRFDGQPSRWVEKTPRHSEHIADILEHFPDASIFYLIRDPRDALSKKIDHTDFAHPGIRLNRINEKADRWRTTVSRTLDFVQEEKRCKVVRYEDIVVDPERTVQGMVSFVSEDFEKEMLTEFSKHYEQVTIPSERGWKKQLSARDVILDRRGIWKERLGKFDAFAIEEVCSAQMSALGFPRQDLSQAQVSEFRARMDRLSYHPISITHRLNMRIKEVGRNALSVGRKLLRQWT